MNSKGISRRELVSTGPGIADGSSRTGDPQLEGRATPLVAIVDDDVDVLRSLERLLRTACYRTQTFTSAEEFLTSDAREHIACLVLDMELQGMNGLDLQNHLLSQNVQPPIVFLTGIDIEIVRSSALGAGAVAFLGKPIDEEDLLVAVYTAVGG